MGGRALLGLPAPLPAYEASTFHWGAEPRGRHGRMHVQEPGTQVRIYFLKDGRDMMRRSGCGTSGLPEAPTGSPAR